ncbi:MAG: hypothetical protein NT067_05825 [Candidatus Diapherotrites archaeon]|nr:hypothetical protein [Candidatus Diapherotrites archaeon]
MPFLPNWGARIRLRRAIGKAIENESKGIGAQRKPRMTSEARTELTSQIQAAERRLGSLNMEIKTAKDRLGIADAESQKAISKAGSEDLRGRVGETADRARNYGRVGLRFWRLNHLEKQAGMLNKGIKRGRGILDRNS